MPGCLARIACWAALLCTAAAHADTLKVAASKGAVSLTLHVAAARGYFAAEGLDVTLVDCSSGRDCFGLMAHGQAQVSTAAEVVATLNREKLPELAIIATISTSSHQIKLIGRHSLGTTSAAGLEGKRVGTVPGSSAQYFFDTWLTFHGLDPGRVTTVGMRPDDIATSLQQGRIDAAVIWDPTATAALRAVGNDGVVLPNPRVYTQHFSLMATRATILTERVALLKLLSGLVKAEKFIASDPQRASEILAARLGIEPAAARAQMAEHDFRIRLDQALISTLSSQARWALRARLVVGPRIPDPTSLVYTDLMARVAPAAITVVK